MNDNVVKLKTGTDLDYFESVEGYTTYQAEEAKLRDTKLTPLDTPFSWRDLVSFLKFWS